MKIKFLKNEINYDGSQLYTHFGFERGIKGNSIVGFIGEANVETNHMIDKEDVVNEDFIYSDKMLHIIVTLFDNNDIEKSVLYQRMFMRIIKDVLNNVCRKERFELVGDDIIERKTGKKLSVSIATISHFAKLIHIGLNIIPLSKKVKVETISLQDVSKTFEKNIEGFFHDISEKFVREYESVKKATFKVKAVS